MRKITLEDLFRDAPFFRRHEGLVGAKYHIKGPDDPNAPGLWFAKVPERISIAKQKPVLTASVIIKPSGKLQGDVNAFNVLTGRGSKEATLDRYEFTPTDIAPGDAIYDYHITFNGFRDGWNQDDKGPGWAARMYKAEVENGAVIHYHIPKDVFHARYELDDVAQCYREKPYRIKFVLENLMVEMPDGSVEQVPADCEIYLEPEKFSVGKPGLFPARDSRVICGQPLDFYLKELRQFQIDTRGNVKKHLTLNDLELFMGDHGMGLSLSRISGEKPRNPYESFLNLYKKAVNAFNKAGMVLGPEQSGELNNHIYDIEARHAYFERKPVIL